MASTKEVALRMLDGCFWSGPVGAAAPDRGGSGAVPLWPFQVEALIRLRGIIERRGGAILADSVGLGKTHVALALAAGELEAGGDCVLVVPASLRPFWKRKLGLVGSPRPRLVSHTQLARGAPVAAPVGRRLVVVDEAHRFRNPNTLRYAALSRLLRPERLPGQERGPAPERQRGPERGPDSPAVRVLLVTATPVNNGLQDLLHLLRLFAADDGFRDLGVASLVGAFETFGPAPWDGAGHGAREPIDSPVTRIVRAVVVRRTRAMVRSRFDDSGAFPRRAAPRVVAYTDTLLRGRVRWIRELELPLYDAPGARAGEDRRARGSGGGHGAGALVRIGLLKRLDSSRHAFESSVAGLRRQARLAMAAIEVGRLPDLSVARGRDGSADPLQLVLVEVVSRPAPPAADLDALAAALHRDLDRLGRLLDPGCRYGAEEGVGDTWDPGEVDGGARDPKLDALVRLLDGTRGERTLVFTEYRDTARAVWLGLVARFRVGRVDGDGAWLGRQPAGRRVVVERFAPMANGRRRVPLRERVDVLVATDVLSEGLNLQDARQVVSYDLPWNPVRLLQRIGRIDRAGSPHREIVPYLFAPTAGLDEALGLTRRLRAKLTSIGATVGAEHADAVLDELLAREVGPAGDGIGRASPGVGRALARVESRQDDPIERLRTLWVRHREDRCPEPNPVQHPQPGTDPDLRCPDLASVQVDETSPAAPLAWVVAVRAGPDPATTVLVEVDRQGRARRAGRAAAHVFQVAVEEAEGDQDPGAGLPADLPWRALRELLLRTEASAAAPAPLAARDPARLLAGRLQRALARAPGIDPTLLAEADALLAGLATPPSPRAAARLGEMVDRVATDAAEPSREDIRHMVRSIRDGLEGPAADPGRGSPRPAATPHGDRIEIVGALRVVVVPRAPSPAPPPTAAPDGAVDAS